VSGPIQKTPCLPDLGRPQPVASKATESSDRSVKSVPPPGAKSSHFRNTKSGHRAGLNRSTPPSSLIFSRLCAHIEKHDGSPDSIEPEGSRSVVSEVKPVASNRWLSDTISSETLSIVVFSDLCTKSDSQRRESRSRLVRKFGPAFGWICRTSILRVAARVSRKNRLLSIKVYAWETL
jgi:hypothetical protein